MNAWDILADSQPHASNRCWKWIMGSLTALAKHCLPAFREWKATSAFKHNININCVPGTAFLLGGRFFSLPVWEATLSPVICVSEHRQLNKVHYLHGMWERTVEMHLLGCLNTLQCVWFLAARCNVLSRLLQVQHWFWGNGLWAGWLNKLLEFSAGIFSQGQEKFVADHQKRRYSWLQGYVRLLRCFSVQCSVFLSACCNFDVKYPADLRTYETAFV